MNPTTDPALTLSATEVRALRRAIDRLCGQVYHVTAERPRLIRDSGNDRLALANALVKLGLDANGELRTPEWIPPNSDGPFNPIQIRDPGPRPTEESVSYGQRRRVR